MASIPATGEPVRVRRATVEDVATAAPLFAAYRTFYGQAYDEVVAAEFLLARLRAGESVVLLAERAGRAVGLVQLYPGFSSVQAAVTWLLGDLYVAENARGTGGADALMAAAEAAAREAGAVSMSLETAHDNTVAQRVYDRHGYIRDETYRTYDKPLG